MFDFGKITGSVFPRKSLKKRFCNKVGKLFNRVCKLLHTAGKIREENETMAKEVQKIAFRIDNTKDLEDDCKYLEKQIKTDRLINKKLKRQIDDLKVKLESQEVLEEKCITRREELQQLEESNEKLLEEVVALNLKLKDSIVLKETYKLMEGKKKILTQQNNFLMKHAEKVRQKVFQREHTERTPLDNRREQSTSSHKQNGKNSKASLQDKLRRMTFLFSPAKTDREDCLSIEMTQYFREE